MNWLPFLLLFYYSQKKDLFTQEILRFFLIFENRALNHNIYDALNWKFDFFHISHTCTNFFTDKETFGFFYRGCPLVRTKSKQIVGGVVVSCMPINCIKTLTFLLFFDLSFIRWVNFLCWRVARSFFLPFIYLLPLTRLH